MSQIPNEFKALQKEMTSLAGGPKKLEAVLGAPKNLQVLAACLQQPVPPNQITAITGSEEAATQATKALTSAGLADAEPEGLIATEKGQQFAGNLAELGSSVRQAGQTVDVNEVEAPAEE